MRLPAASCQPVPPGSPLLAAETVRALSLYAVSRDPIAGGPRTTSPASTGHRLNSGASHSLSSSIGRKPSLGATTALRPLAYCASLARQLSRSCLYRSARSRWISAKAAPTPGRPPGSRCQLGGAHGSCGRGRPWRQRPLQPRSWRRVEVASGGGQALRASDAAILAEQPSEHLQLLGRSSATGSPASAPLILVQD